jgi:hypothetical protein
MERCQAVVDRDVPAGLTAAWTAATADPDALDALRSSRRLYGELSGWQGRLVVEGLRAGATWEQIGAALGTTRQAAWARFRHVVEQADGRRGPMPEQIAALRARLDDEVKVLQDKLKALDAEWRADRGRLQEELRALDRARAEQRKALKREVRETAERLRDEIRALREAPA